MIVTKGMYDKEFKFDNNGKEETIIIKPLQTKYLPKMFKISKAFNGIDKSLPEEEQSSQIVDILTRDDIMPALIDVVYETVKKSYPEMEKDGTLDEFVSANMFKLLPFIIDVNFKR